MAETKVFTSGISRTEFNLQNDLLELLQIEPAHKTGECDTRENDCDFKPITDKCYVPKGKNSRIRVKTVRDIRVQYEKDVMTFLPDDLEKQKTILLKKIREGCADNPKTKALAKNMLNGDNPISRTARQMLMHLNPNEHAHSAQYVLWNGRRIQVSGSKGGKSEFICGYDLANNKPLKSNKLVTRKKVPKKKGLLNNSLAIKFKPGPLTKKRYLDDSYQKYHVGSTELIPLPKLGLDIQPRHGIALEPTITNFLHNLREVDGTISDNWAEFATSMLGAVTENGLSQMNKNSITFDLNYICNQRQLLMRRNLVDSSIKNEHFLALNSTEDIMSEVTDVINRLVDAVDISLNEDNFYTGIDEPRDKDCAISTPISSVAGKAKKRYRGELGKLDVTIITLSDSQTSVKDSCSKAHCAMGCICSSLICDYKLKCHCGRLECMFECKCDFSKYRMSETFEGECSELMPGLLNLDNEINMKLAKEEQKFHQTVIVSGDKSILLKSRKRTWKASKRYSDFFSQLSLKSEIKEPRILSVIDHKLDCTNIEPWCMVHQLYKCFCKGKFVDSNIPLRDKAYETINDINTSVELDHSKFTDAPVKHQSRPRNKLHANILNKSSKGSVQVQVNADSSKNDFTFSESLDDTDQPLLGNDIGDNRMTRTRSKLLSATSTLNPLILRRPSRSRLSSSHDNALEVNSDRYNSSAARSRGFCGRKFRNKYYKETNSKIALMEENDLWLQKRLTFLMSRDTSKSTEESVVQVEHIDKQRICTAESKTGANPQSKSRTKSEKQMVVDLTDNDKPSPSQTSTDLTGNDTGFPTKMLPNKNKLISWLELNYKHYKQLLTHGITKTSLEPPRQGRVALYPWEFILNRYRERKNLFLVNKQKPFRIFMAVNAENALFKNCMNIDDIRFADLPSYPVTVKNLLTNATDLKDSFCILCGLAHCWELIGAVTKLDEDSKNTEGNSSGTSISLLGENIDFPDSFEHTPETKLEEPTQDTNKICSKWFIMTIENDFTEIQFYKKGFFVKYENIIKAIKVARMSGKTVRLSSQKCVDPADNGPPFGIYAVPKHKENIVYIGPYERDQDLGIETVKNTVNMGRHKRTRGVWLTTSKIDNGKVIDNPLSFLPSNDCETDNFEDESDQCEASENVSNTPVKTIKPIKVRKSNGFYLNKLFKPLTLNSNLLLEELPHGSATQALVSNMGLQSNPSGRSILLRSPPLIKSCETSTTSKSDGDDSGSQKVLRPVAEIAPQIKITNNLSKEQLSEKNMNTNNRQEKGMFILKPEQINKKLEETQMFHGVASEPKTWNDLLESRGSFGNETDTIFDADNAISVDIEKFLQQSVAQSNPCPEVLEISDEECGSKTVYLECLNYDIFGWIPGKMDEDKKISFQFPCFNFTEFYPAEKAFEKINQVISRMVYVPEGVTPKWRAVESKSKLVTKRKMTHRGFSKNIVWKQKINLSATANETSALQSGEVWHFDVPRGEVSDSEDTNESISKKEPMIYSD